MWQILLSRDFLTILVFQVYSDLSFDYLEARLAPQALVLCPTTTLQFTLLIIASRSLLELQPFALRPYFLD